MDISMTPISRCGHARVVLSVPVCSLAVAEQNQNQLIEG
jgi:hypothetical protein